jgi:hypothetical protein
MEVRVPLRVVEEEVQAVEVAPVQEVPWCWVLCRILLLHMEFMLTRHGLRHIRLDHHKCKMGPVEHLEWVGEEVLGQQHHIYMVSIAAVVV